MVQFREVPLKKFNGVLLFVTVMYSLAAFALFVEWKVKNRMTEGKREAAKVRSEQIVAHVDLSKLSAKDVEFLVKCCEFQSALGQIHRVNVLNVAMTIEIYYE